MQDRSSSAAIWTSTNRSPFGRGCPQWVESGYQVLLPEQMPHLAWNVVCPPDGFQPKTCFTRAANRGSLRRGSRNGSTCIAPIPESRSAQAVRSASIALSLSPI